MLKESPQFLQPDSSRKSSDKLPFAPFINSEKQKEKAEEQLKVVSRKNITEKKTSSTSPLIRDSNTVVRTTPYLFQLSQSKDSSQAVNQSSTGTTAIDTNSFRFADDDNDIQTVNEKTWLNSTGYFKPHVLQPDGLHPVLNSTLVPDWFTVVLFLVVAGITVIKVFYSKIFKQLFNAFYSLAVTSQVVRDENILVQRASILLNVIFYGSAGLFLYYVSVRFNWNHPVFNEGILRFFFFAFVTAVFFSIKMLLLKVLSAIFEIEKPVSIYIFSIFLTNNMLGMFLVPLIACIAYVYTPYTNYLIYSCIAVILLAFGYLLYRAVAISSTLPRFSLYYLFLYFCTLEIAPLLLIIKASTR